MSVAPSPSARSGRISEADGGGKSEPPPPPTRHSEDDSAAAATALRRRRQGRRRSLVTLLVATTASLAGAAVSVILFLVPFTIDPAISALRQATFLRNSPPLSKKNPHVSQLQVRDYLFVVWLPGD